MPQTHGGHAVHQAPSHVGVTGKSPHFGPNSFEAQHNATKGGYPNMTPGMTMGQPHNQVRPPNQVNPQHRNPQAGPGQPMGGMQSRPMGQPPQQIMYRQFVGQPGVPGAIPGVAMRMMQQPTMGQQHPRPGMPMPNQHMIINSRQFPMQAMQPGPGIRMVPTHMLNQPPGRVMLGPQGQPMRPGVVMVGPQGQPMIMAPRPGMAGMPGMIQFPYGGGVPINPQQQVGQPSGPMYPVFQSGGAPGGMTTTMVPFPNQ